MDKRTKMAKRIKKMLAGHVLDLEAIQWLIDREVELNKIKKGIRK